MIAVAQAIVVEGRYDKNRLSQIFDALIVPVNGFSIFKDTQTLALLRRLAVERGIIVLTDPDGAGLVIRNFLRSAIQDGQMYHAYVGVHPGREKRKRTPSKEGLLGVEGVSEEEIIRAVQNCGAARGPIDAVQESITAGDMYELGLSGRPNSTALRLRLLERLGLPLNMSTTALRRYLSGQLTAAQLAEIVQDLQT